jgi:hypothetical protein
LPVKNAQPGPQVVELNSKAVGDNVPRAALKATPARDLVWLASELKNVPSFVSTKKV